MSIANHSRKSNSSFEADLSKMVGLTCWAVIAGKGNGSMMTLDFGRRVPVYPPLRNERLSNELRQFQGEYCVFVEGCAWRLEGKKRVICGWGEKEIVIEKKVQRLVGCKLTNVEFSNWALDLNLSFDDRYLLRLFCDQTAGTLDNYSIRFPSGWYSVRPQSKLAREATETGVTSGSKKARQKS